MRITTEMVVGMFRRIYGSGRGPPTRYAIILCIYYIFESQKTYYVIEYRDMPCGASNFGINHYNKHIKYLFNDNV